MIAVKQINRNIIDLSDSPKFLAHYVKGNTYAKYIIDNEINRGFWYDSILASIPLDAVIVDAGMNVGLFTAYMNIGKRKFYCIEPTPIHVEIAKELFEKQNVDAQIFEGVIYNKDGEVGLFEEESNSTMNRVVESATLRMTKAKTLKTLFSDWGLEKVDLLKLDIESGEQKVILEDPTVDEPLKICKIVFIEVHPQDGFGNKVDVEGIINKMKGLGFTHKAGMKEFSHYFIQP